MKRTSSRRCARPALEVLEGRCLPALFAPSIRLETLAATPYRGFALNGFVPDSAVGSYVRGIGDVNGDGIDDIAVGSPGPSIFSDGQVFVVFGRKSPSFGTALPLNTLDGLNGFTINGAPGGNACRVATAGDVNGDGIDDLLIGAPDTQTGFAFVPGTAYIVFGKATGFSATLNLATLTASDGVVIVGVDHGGAFGDSVAGVGDVNNDGIDDVLIGAPNHHGGGPSFRGQAFVIFGNSTGFPASINVSSLDGTNGFAINGVSGFDKAGTSVAAAGDINGDGVKDLLIGAPSTFDGHVYAVFGRSTFTASLDLASLDGTNGFAINPFADDCQVGLAETIAGGGDVNGDGIADILLGSRTSDGLGLNAGEAYVIYGRPATSSFDATFDLSLLTGAGASTRGFIVNGILSGGFLGAAVAFADVNTDGLADLVLGASLAYHFGEDFTSGIVYVMLGRRGGFATAQNVGSLTGNTGFSIRGFGDFANAGTSVASAGDFNGDGSGDLILGMPSPQNPSADPTGQAFIIYGKYGPPTAAMTPPANVTTSGGRFSQFAVTYSDTEAVLAWSIGTGDVFVTGPDGIPRLATLVAVNSRRNGPVRTAVYRLVAPGGFWDFRDNGTYTVHLASNQVFDVYRKPAAGRVLGSFTVNAPVKVLAVGNNTGSPGRVQVFSPDGSPMYTITAFPAPFAGGVRVAVGDVNNDGTPDVIAAPAGITTEIRVFNGRDGTPLAGFTPLQPYGAAFTGGAYVAAADFDGIPGAEIIVGPGAGPDNPVLVFNGVGTVLANIVAYDMTHTGGVRVAAGNLTGDGRAEIVTSADGGINPVKAFDQDGALLWSVQAYANAGGTFVSVGDIDGDGTNEVTTGPEGRNVPFVKVYTGATGAPVTGQIQAFAANFFGGVRVAVADVNGDSKMELLVTAGNGRIVRVYDWVTKRLIDSFGAFELLFNRGLFVAGS